MKSKTSNASLVYAVLSNSIVLVLIGFFTILYLHINSITNLVKEKINILVELNQDSTGTVIIEQSQKKIAQNPKVVPGSVKFISKENAEEVLGLTFGDELKSVGNPFKDIISFNVKAQFYTETNLQKIKTELQSRPEVFSVFYENVVIENIKSNLKNTSYIVLILSLIFIFLAIVIIYNTTNLSLYADRWEIKTMEIIGARDNFIRQPYIKMSGNIALKSFAISALVLLLVIIIFVFRFGFNDIINWFFVLLTFLMMFIVSVVITVFSTIFIVNRYLYKKKEELY